MVTSCPVGHVSSPSVVSLSSLSPPRRPGGDGDVLPRGPRVLPLSGQSVLSVPPDGQAVLVTSCPAGHVSSPSVVSVLSVPSDGQAVMVTSCPAGHIAFWDLEKRKLLSQILAAHDGAVTGLKCLASQPLMVTSSPDNAIKVRRHRFGAKTASGFCCCNVLMVLRVFLLIAMFLLECSLLGHQL